MYNNPKREVTVMQQVVDVKTMRESDAMTIHGGIPGRELMCRAGKAILESYPWQGPVAIVCGSGNNGGDGYVLADLLWEQKIPVVVFLLSDRFSEDGRFYFETCRAKGVDVRPWTPEETFADFSEIVDCILGTGFAGEVQGRVADVIRAINQSGKTVISVDINSGMNGDNGTSSLCVHSDLTVSLGFYKIGHFLNDAKDVIGRVINRDIGIDLYGSAAYLVEAEDLGAVLRPRRQNSHKGDYGYVSILGGCTSYAGAVKLANLSCAALRAGCGVAQVILPMSIKESVAPHLLESTMACLPDDGEGHMTFSPAALNAALSKQKALAIGMGWGRSPEYARILEHILRTQVLSLVIDADGLNTLAEMDPSILKSTACSVLLTPHLKEFERLSGVPMKEIQTDPIGHAMNYAKKTGVVLLLKGPCTVITNGEEVLLVNRGCAGMATAGSGDVLAGVLVGLLGAAPVSPLTAACGAYVAGLAGELAQAESNPISMLASDTVAKIPAAISTILKAIREKQP